MSLLEDGLCFLVQQGLTFSAQCMKIQLVALKLTIHWTKWTTTTTTTALTMKTRANGKSPLELLQLELELELMTPLPDVKESFTDWSSKWSRIQGLEYLDTESNK